MFKKLSDIDDLKPVERMLEASSWGASQALLKMLRHGEVKADTDREVYFLYDHGEILGHACLVARDYLERPQYGPWLSMLYIKPERRGEGWSRQFVAFLEEELWQKGYKKAYIATQHQGLYERFGYQLLEEAKDGIHEIDYVYKKFLS